MLGIKVPKSDDVLRWADWLEISAAFNADGNSSRAELEGALRLSPFFERSGQEGIALRASEVFVELGERAKAARDAYPFALERTALQLRSSIEDYAAYFFCLALSYCGWTRKKGDKIFPERMFEDLSVMAAKSYTGGDVVRFAYPRKAGPRELPAGFKDAIQRTTQLIGEGDSCRHRPARATKDDALDVFAWRHFPDLLPGKLILVGQCAAGEDWNDKLTDLQPVPTTDEWMTTPIISQMLRAIFIPHRVPRAEWERCNRRAGIVFDRCRLAYWSHRAEHLAKMDPYRKWSRSRIKSVLIEPPKIGSRVALGRARRQRAKKNRG